MADIEQFSALIGDIYDASLDPALWPSVCESIGAFVGASATVLGWQDTVRKTADFLFTWGCDQVFIDAYRETYCKLNPAFPTVLFFDVEEPHSIVPDCISREEYCRSRFGREWLAPQGLVDSLFINVDKTATTCHAFHAARRMTDGFADEKMHRRFALAAPHIRRAVLIGQVIDRKT